MSNIMLRIAYDGTRYVGWQIQPNGVSIEEKLVQSIEKVTGEKVTLYGSGRTDSGVHALGQVANFHTTAHIPPERFAFAINAYLPKDIRVMTSEAVPVNFHSRYSAVGKAYLYQIDTGVIPSPFTMPYTWHVPYSLDMSALKKAKAAFVGRHDFAAFMASGSAVTDTVRQITALEMMEADHILKFRFTGNGFLYNMVRIIMGTIIDVGLGKLSADKIPAIIAEKDRRQAGMTAPAKGLFLERVFYPENDEKSKKVFDTALSLS